MVIRDDGLIVTIGYLITEADAIWITTTTTASSGAIPAYDFTTGMGLVPPLRRCIRARPDRQRREVGVEDDIRP